MKRLLATVLFCAVFPACGSGRTIDDPAINDPADRANTGANGDEIAAVELSLTGGNYYVCTRKDAAYRDGSVTLTLANHDTIDHAIEVTGVELRTVDGVVVARAGAFGLYQAVRGGVNK